VDKKFRLTLSSVFSFSSSHSLSEPPRDVHRGGGADNEPMLELMPPGGLAGIMVTATGASFWPASSKSPCPASSLHWTFLHPLAGFFSLSETLRYGCEMLDRNDFRGERMGRRDSDTERLAPKADDRREVDGLGFVCKMGGPELTLPRKCQLITIEGI